MYLYLYIDISVFVHISTPSAEQPWILPCAWHRRALALKLRLLWERESSGLTEQCESSKLGRSLSCDKKRNFTTLCWNFAYVTYHHIAELLPFKPAKIITQLHQFWQKRQETTQCNNHHNYPPHTYIPKTKTFHLVVTCFTQIPCFFPVCRELCKWVSLSHGCKGIHLKAYNWTNLLWPNASLNFQKLQYCMLAWFIICTIFDKTWTVEYTSWNSKRQVWSTISSQRIHLFTFLVLLNWNSYTSVLNNTIVFYHIFWLFCFFWGHGWKSLSNNTFQRFFCCSRHQ